MLSLSSFASTTSAFVLFFVFYSIHSVLLFIIYDLKVESLSHVHFQLEDAEFNAQSALKARKKLEEDVTDLQNQVDSLLKSKKEVRRSSC